MRPQRPRSWIRWADATSSCTPLVPRGGIFPGQPDEEMIDGFALKFRAGVRLARLLWPSLKDRHGTVINIVGGFARTRPQTSWSAGQ